MLSKNLRFIYLLSAISLPFLILASPAWMTLQGVAPCWPILWLLPWSLQFGPKAGLIAGLCLGLLGDAITLGGATQVLALTILGFWWGRIGKKGLPINLSLNLGLLAWIGTILFGLTVWMQLYIFHGIAFSSWFNAWAFHTLFSKAIITALLAPIISSWLLLAASKRFA
tara:strand:- start:391 stop:897 length:507 start_codon:yes stop_codon:yes gene_type:complete